MQKTIHIMSSCEMFHKLLQHLCCVKSCCFFKMLVIEPAWFLKLHKKDLNATFLLFNTSHFLKLTFYKTDAFSEGLLSIEKQHLLRN